jgi:hypothetical protein
MSIVAQTPRRRSGTSRSNGEGAVWEDKANHRWVGTITLGWEYVDDGKGGTKRRQLRKSVSGPTKREVVRKLREFHNKGLLHGSVTALLRNISPRNVALVATMRTRRRTMSVSGSGTAAQA